MVNPSISDPLTVLYNGRLPDGDLCPNQMTVEGTTFCNEVYNLFSGNAKDANNKGKARSANNPEYKKMNSAIAEGKYEHTDANVIRNVEVQGLALENERGTGREGALRGSSDAKMIPSFDRESLDKGDYYSLSLERVIDI
jgi:hypothetical protein